MLHIVTEQNRATSTDLLDQMHVLRAEQFHDRRKWQVSVVAGRERDVYDQLNPLYVLVSNGEGRLLGSARLLTTNGPHMLANTFPETMGEDDPIRHPLVWEVSRFCVDTEASRSYGDGGVNEVTREVLFGIFDTALNHGIDTLVAVHDLFMNRIMKRSGCDMRQLGPVVQYDDGLKTVAVEYAVNQEVLDRVSPKFSKPAVQEQRIQSPLLQPTVSFMPSAGLELPRAHAQVAAT